MSLRKKIIAILAANGHNMDAFEGNNVQLDLNDEHNATLVDRAALADELEPKVATLESDLNTAKTSISEMKSAADAQKIVSEANTEAIEQAAELLGETFAEDMSTADVIGKLASMANVNPNGGHEETPGNNTADDLGSSSKNEFKSEADAELAEILSQNNQ